MPQPIRVPAIPRRVPAFTTPPFPSKVRGNNQISHALQTCLNDAILNKFGRSWTVPMVMIDLGAGTPHPMAVFRPDEMHYSASMLKVSAMYAAYQLRHTLRKMAAEGRSTSTSFLQDAYLYLKPHIIEGAKKLPPLKKAATENGGQAVLSFGHFSNMFHVSKNPALTGGIQVDFTCKGKWNQNNQAEIGYQQALEGMIVHGENQPSRQCIIRLGFGYLNSCLHHAVFFEPSSQTGIWLGGDYIGIKYTVPSVNDGQVAQATNVIKMAELLSLIFTHKIVDWNSCNEMNIWMEKVVTTRGEVWLAQFWMVKKPHPSNPSLEYQPTQLNFEVKQTKIGSGELKVKPKGSWDKLIRSECSVLFHGKTGRNYVLVWQNLVLYKDKVFDPLAQLVMDTLDRYAIAIGKGP
jgi:hypothetical protein